MRALGHRWGRSTVGLLGTLAVVPALVAAAPLGAQAPTLGELYRTTSPSVVGIRAKGNQVTSSGVVGYGEIGSGVLVSRDGRVLTASHVVHGMEDITVEFVGREPVRARMLGFQPTADLALLQLETVLDGAPIAALADSDRVQVGDPVYIIGAPYGLTYSLSTEGGALPR